VKKRLIIAAVVLVLLLGSSVARYCLARRLPADAAKRVKASTLRLADSFAPGENLTYAQLFAKLQKNAADVDSDVIAVQAEGSSLNEKPTRSAAAYMRAIAGVIRAEEIMAQKAMTVESARQAAESAQRAAQLSLDATMGSAAKGAEVWQYFQQAAEGTGQSAMELTRAFCDMLPRLQPRGFSVASTETLTTMLGKLATIRNISLESLVMGLDRLQTGGSLAGYNNPLARALGLAPESIESLTFSQLVKKLEHVDNTSVRPSEGAEGHSVPDAAESDFRKAASNLRIAFTVLRSARVSAADYVPNEALCDETMINRASAAVKTPQPR